MTKPGTHFTYPDGTRQVSDPAHWIWITMSKVVDGRMIFFVLVLFAVGDKQPRPLETTLGVN